MTHLAKLALAFVVASVVAAPATYAAATTVTVMDVDPAQHLLKAEDGKTFSVDARLPLSSLKPGDKVMMTYRDTSPVWQSLGIVGFATEVSSANL
jgi:hypothetical protein